MALPVADPARVPAPLRRAADGGRRSCAAAGASTGPRKGEAFIPVEFQGAAYRFGHSMVRPSYRANLAGDDGKPFFALIFDVSTQPAPDPDDLRGGFRAPRRFIGWQTFFDFGDGQVKPNKRIDTKHLDAALPPPARRDRLPLRPDRAPGAHAAPATDLGAPIRPGARPADGRHGSRARRPRRAAGLRARAGALDAALVLRAQGGRADRGRPATSGRSAAGSSPR